MGIIKGNSQQGQNDLFECTCGQHLIRIYKDEPYVSPKGIKFPLQHSLQFWEYRGDTNWTIWDRWKLAFRILIGKEAKYPTYDVIITEHEVEELAEAIRRLNN